MTTETPERFAPGLEDLLVPVDQLKHYGRNPRRGDVEAIRASLTAHGQYRPVVVRRQTGEVLAGNHTLKAARSLGWTRLAATWVDADDAEAARIALVDNRGNELAGYDDTLLLAALNALPDLTGTGFTDEDRDRLERAVRPLDEGFLPPSPVPDDAHDGGDAPSAPATVTCPDCSCTFVRQEQAGP